ncbi:Putative cyclin-D6-1 [Morus notabilis]|uniref:Putative cyclin-D6-1 n=1 Tax=Morus notabilis TaxID=981085 RepID=W9RRT0_9ROSA|nr:Putative cyclin-D6-1 [Morus notabilis]
MNLEVDYDPNNPLPDLSPAPELGKQGVERFLNAEASSMAASGYLDDRFAPVWRERAVIVIFNVSRQEHFEPFIPYLAMNYFDRYISREKKIPAQNPELRAVMPWEFLTMELHIVKGLDWRMCSVTALCFVQFFAPYFESTYGFRRRTINEIIIQSQNDYLMSRFRPSVIAASALLAASSFLYAEQFESFLEKIASQIIFRKEEVLKCMENLIDMCKDLRIQIESAVPENEYLPKRKVRAGETSEQAAERSKTAAAEITHRATSEKSNQNAALTSEQAADSKSKQVAVESCKQVAAQKPEQSTEERKQMAIERSKVVTTETSEWLTVTSTEQVAGKKFAEYTEEPKQEAAEKLEEVATESFEQLIIVPSEKAVAQKSEESSEEPENVAIERSEEVAAKKSEESIDEPKETAIESLKEKAVELSAKQTDVPNEQVAARKTVESAAQESTHAASKSSKEMDTESSECSSVVGAPSSARTSSQRSSNCKEKVVEMTEMSKMVEDSENMAFDFALRWRLGEENAEDFVIFTAMEDLDGALRVPCAPEEQPDLGSLTPEKFKITELHILKELDWCARAKLRATGTATTILEPSVITTSVVRAASKFLYPQQR